MSTSDCGIAQVLLEREPLWPSRNVERTSPFSPDEGYALMKKLDEVVREF